jgi:hypothetical protein
MEVFMKDKSKWFFMGMTVLLLSFGLVMASCADEAAAANAGANIPTGNNNSNGGGGSNNNNNNNNDNNNDDDNNNNNDDDNNNTDGDDDVYTPPSDNTPRSVAITGELVVGKTLDATAEGFSGNPLVQWQTIDAESAWIYNSTQKNQYVIMDNNEGRFIRAFVVDDANNKKVYSSILGPIKPAPVENVVDDDPVDDPVEDPVEENPSPGLPRLNGKLAVTGSGRAMEKLYVSFSYTPLDDYRDGGEITVRWERAKEGNTNYVAIPGMTINKRTSEYLPTLADIDYYIRVEASVAGYEGKLTFTIQIEKPILTGTVTVDGVPAADSPLTANIKNANGNGAFKYKWEISETRNGPWRNTGDNSPTYTPSHLGDVQVAVDDNFLKYGDVDKYVRVWVSREGAEGKLVSEPTNEVVSQMKPWITGLPFYQYGYADANFIMAGTDFKTITGTSKINLQNTTKVLVYWELSKSGPDGPWENVLELRWRNKIEYNKIPYEWISTYTVAPYNYSSYLRLKAVSYWPNFDHPRTVYSKPWGPIHVSDPTWLYIHAEDKHRYFVRHGWLDE